MKPAKITALILFLSIVIIGVGEQIYLSKTFKRFDEYTSDIKSMLDASDFKGAVKKTESLEKWWDKKSLVLEILSHSRDTKAIAAEAARLRGYSTTEASSDAKVSLVSLEALGTVLKKLLSFRPENIT